MKYDDFASSPAGTLAPTIQNCWAFVPNPLPPDLDLAALAAPLARASLALGELSGIGRIMPDPYLLVNPFLRKEAVASSRIEGIVTTFGDLLLYEAGAEEKGSAPDAREVHNYVRAMRHGIDRLDELPVCLRLMNELHGILLEGVHKKRGAGISPGEFRRDQNWIGSRLLQNARFVPPPADRVMPLLDGLEKYLQEPPDPDLPILIRIALLHYQFESIHPYPDGNGRVGRLLIPLILCEKKIMSQPLLYLSDFFENHKERYIDLLFSVSKNGSWKEWIEFFLQGIEEKCNDAIKKIQQLRNMQEQYRSRVQKARSSVLLIKLVDLLFALPAMTVPLAAERLNISYNAAKNNLQRLTAAGIIEPINLGRRRFWLATEIVDVMDEDRSGI